MNQPMTPLATAIVHGSPRTDMHILRDFEHFPVAALLKRADPALYRQCLDWQRRVRLFTDQHVRPHAAEWDMEVGRDHNFVPWQAIDAGLKTGLFSMAVPAIFGGGNLGPVPVGVVSEELGAADAGLFVVYGAHSLAWMLLIASLDLRMLRRMGRELAEGEKNGKPVILALAHTEVTGGSDVEDVDDIHKARLGSRWKKVPGGYLVSARKVFCSNGGIARYIVLTAYGDYARPMETMRSFVIPADAAGLSIGRPERKMGQRLCMANEVACDELFVADEDCVQSADPGRTLDTTLTLTRGPVGAMSAGIIRGALERTLAYLAQKRTARGGWLYDEQWVQMILADMIGQLQAARGLYFDAAIAADEWGFSQFMRQMPGNVPDAVVRSGAMRLFTDQPWSDALVRKHYNSRVSGWQVQRLAAQSSVAKFMGSDMAVNACMKAMEILGEDANDAQWGVEKCLRDAKLAQIFEGTNQINRMHVTRGLLA